MKYPRAIDPKYKITFLAVCRMDVSTVLEVQKIRLWQTSIQTNKIIDNRLTDWLGNYLPG